MTSWPSRWRTLLLDAAGIPITEETMAILKAWNQSTPLPPYTHNPLGMPKGLHGASGYLNTGYGMFPTMKMHTAAFVAFTKTYPGQVLIRAMTGDKPHPVTWRVISNLGWPASKTETDYPAKLLDLTEQSYREYVKATPPAQRKTSGTVGVNAGTKDEVMAHHRAMVNAVAATGYSKAAIAATLRGSR